MRRADVARLLDRRNVDPDFLAQIERGGMQIETVRRRPKVELVSG